MSMDRKRRRALAKSRLKVLQGGAPPGPPPDKPLTGTEGFAKGLDRVCSMAVLNDPTLTPQGVLVALMTVAASVAIKLGAGEEDFADAARKFYDDVLSKQPPEPPTGGSA